MKLCKRIRIKFIKAFYAAFTCIILLCPSNTLSQISKGGLPPSFKYQQTLRSLAVETNVPVSFYAKDIQVTDSWQAREGAPMPVSNLISVDYTMDNSGYRTTLPGGEEIWRLNLKAKDAVALMLYYEDFYIPEGGKLFIYSSDKSQILGAYTHETHPSGGLFATEFIGGDELILEYVYPETNKENPRICIDEIGYGYNSAALREFCGITTRASSGSCMVDVNCEEGDAWQNEKKGVCYTIQRVGNKNYICTASLMNNTAEDFKPLVLTARHCAVGGGNTASSSDMEQWLFYFHMEREGCGNEFLPTMAKTMTGCRLLVNTGMGGGSDGMLLLLKNDIPENYDVFYNGWDRRDIVASSGVCIHHPSGDYKKISTYKDNIITYTFSSTEFNGDKNACWNVTFLATTNGHAVTEGGSSGSPLYNENKLVVGTLTGGSSSCVNPKGLNIYGKMSYHWNKYSTDSTTRMDVWLDPLGIGVETFNGRFRKIFKPSPIEVIVVNMGQTISVTWKAPIGDEEPIYYKVYRNNVKIEETVLLSYVDNKPVSGTITYSVSAVYADGEESPSATSSTPIISYVEYKAPSNLKAERNSSTPDEVLLSWDLPYYEQTIFWGTLAATYKFGFGERKPFYYGHKWSQKEISPLNGNLIKEVRFIPLKNNTYKIFISQGDRVYRQDIDPSSLKYLSTNSIILDEPFVIDGTRSLIISIQIPVVGDDYPAVCDDGPVVDGKGNIYSKDGITWDKIYDEEEPGSFNYNFILSALVTSDKVSLTGGELLSKSKVSDSFSEMVISNGDARPRISVQPFNDNEISVRNSVPAAFPEITKLRIYRNGSVFKELTPLVNTYIDKTIYSSFIYEISAFYNGAGESEMSNKTSITYVDIEDVGSSVEIYPTRFSNQISLVGFENVIRVEFISLSGIVCAVVNSPEAIIDTSALSSGYYFIRISENNGRQKVIKAIKGN